MGLPRKGYLLMWTLLGVAVLSLSAVGASSELNFPRLSFEENTVTALAVVNPGAQDAEVKLTVYGSDGQVLQGEGFQNPTDITVAANHQFSAVTAALFGGGLDPSTVAWIQATSPVDDLTGFFLFLDSTAQVIDMQTVARPEFFDGAALPQAAFEIIFNEVRLGPEFSTELNLVNPGNATAAVELQLIGGDNPLQGALQLPPKGAARLDVATFFGVGQPPPASYIIASAAVEIAGFEMIRGQGDLLGTNALPASQLLNTVFFPQLAVLTPFETQLVLGNYGAENAILTLSAHQPDGTLYGGDRLRSNPVTRVLEGGQALREDVVEMFGFFGDETLEGWIDVQSTSQTINGSLSYANSSSGSLAAVTTLAKGSTEAVFSHLATSLGFFTGVAILNPGSLAANVRLVALLPDGTILGSFATTIQPRHRLSRLISDLIGEAADQGGGWVFVRSDVPVYLTSLFGTLDGKVLANIPPQSVPSSFQPDLDLPRLTVDPPLVVVPVGGAQSFELGGSASSPVWSVNDLAGGSNEVGTITGDGLFRAPGLIPNPLPVTVTASADNQTAGSSVDVLSRQALVTNLGIVQSVAYLGGLQRLFNAELTALGTLGSGVRPLRVSQQSTGTVVFDVTGNTKLPLITLAGEEIPKMIPFLAVDGQEDLLLAGRTSGRIIRFRPTTLQSVDVATGLNAPTSLVIDPETGDLLVAEASGIITVSKADLNRGLTATAQGSAGGVSAPGESIFGSFTPAGIAVDRCTGNIYISDPRLGVIVEFDHDTGTLRTVADGLQDPGQLLAFHRVGLDCPFSFHLLVVERGLGRTTLVIPLSGTIRPWMDVPGVVDIAFLPSDNPLVGGQGALLGEIQGAVGQVSVVAVPDLYDARTVNPPSVPACFGTVTLQDPNLEAVIRETLGIGGTSSPGAGLLKSEPGGDRHE